jgi:hypothetical protein
MLENIVEVLYHCGGCVGEKAKYLVHTDLVPTRKPTLLF